MRSKPDSRAEGGRRQGSPGAIWGMFVVPGPCGRELRIISDDGVAPPPDATGWEHVSVSTGHHPPNWQEMAWVKDLFWEDEETVLQFHPKKSEYVNIHPNVLHLWRNVGLNHPLPPKITV
jgi:hypothetical protein